MGTPKLLYDDKHSFYQRDKGYVSVRILVWNNYTWAGRTPVNPDYCQSAETIYGVPLGKRHPDSFWENVRVKALDIYEEKTQQKKEITTMDNLKKYLDKHSDKLFTVMIVVILDHFFLRGALRSRIEKLAEGLMAKVEKDIGGDE